MSQPNRTPQLRICSLSIPALGANGQSVLSHPSTEMDRCLEQLARRWRDRALYIRCATPRQLRTRHAFLAFRTSWAPSLGAFFVACFAFCAMLKCSEFFTGFDAAASQSGVSRVRPRFRSGFVRIAVFGATGRARPSPSPLERDWKSKVARAL